ncbi:MAG: hypothetical protein HUU15_12795 [Candidatus Brocadiae bacterium]|nr:hypothetical protein [Candidatus Brocadiia bacterium]
MRLLTPAFLLLSALGALAQGGPAAAAVEKDARAKIRPVLIWVWSKDDPECARMEKERWSIEPLRSLLREFVVWRADVAFFADPDTWTAVPRWKNLGQGVAKVNDVRIIHPWGAELYRLESSTVTTASSKRIEGVLREVLLAWETRQVPIRQNVKDLDLLLKARDYDGAAVSAEKLTQHHEGWTIPSLAAGLSKPSLKYRETVIPALRKIDEEDGVTALLAWVKTSPGVEGSDLAWKELVAAASPRSIEVLKDRILAHPSVAPVRIAALGRIREAGNIDFLVDLLPKFTVPEQPKPGDAQVAMRDATLTSLRTLTGQNFSSAAEWSDWWAANRAGFQFP